MGIAIHTALLDLYSLDDLSRGTSMVHGLDARAKMLTTAMFVVTVMSFGKYELVALAPFFIYPAFMAGAAGLPARSIVKRLLLALPFALFVGMFNPLIDTDPRVAFNGLTVSGGWLSFASIVIRFMLTVSAALILIAVTGMYRACMALERMGLPDAMAVQLLFLYRYIFVLINEAGRMVRARDMRTFDRSRSGLRLWAHLTGSLLLRTLDRAQRIHLAMVSKGFDGRIRLAARTRIHIADVAFVAVWGAFFILARMYNLPRLMGDFALELVG